MDVPVQVAMETLEPIMDIPQKRPSKRTGKHVAEVPVPHVMKEIFEENHVCSPVANFRAPRGADRLLDHRRVAREILEGDRACPPVRTELRFF